MQSEINGVGKKWFEIKKNGGGQDYGPYVDIDNI